MVWAKLKNFPVVKGLNTYARHTYGVRCWRDMTASKPSPPANEQSLGEQQRNLRAERRKSMNEDANVNEA